MRMIVCKEFECQYDTLGKCYFSKEDCDQDKCMYWDDCDECKFQNEYERFFCRGVMDENGNLKIMDKK